jgi:hypothetical protein
MGIVASAKPVANLAVDTSFSNANHTSADASSDEFQQVSTLCHLRRLSIRYWRGCCAAGILPGQAVVQRSAMQIASLLSHEKGTDTHEEGNRPRTVASAVLNMMKDPIVFANAPVGIEFVSPSVHSLFVMTRDAMRRVPRGDNVDRPWSREDRHSSDAQQGVVCAANVRWGGMSRPIVAWGLPLVQPRVLRASDIK